MAAWRAACSSYTSCTHMVIYVAGIECPREYTNYHL
jgi:hypothetical protein